MQILGAASWNEASIPPLAWMFFNLALVFLFRALSYYPFVIGKALASLALGFRLHKLVLGVGRPAWILRPRGTRLEFRPIPNGVAFAAGPLRVGCLRTRLALVWLSGALTNCVLVAIILTTTRVRGIELADFTTHLSPLHDLVVANLVLILTEVFAKRLLIPIGDRLPDRINILRALFLSDVEKSDMVAFTYALEGHYCMEEGNPSGALSWHDLGLDLNPGSALLCHDRAVTLIDLGRLQEAKDSLLTMLAMEQSSSTLRAFAKNNIAAINLLLPSRQDLLEEADRYSEESLKLAASVPAAQATRGAVLVELGRLEEGTAILKAALTTANRPSTKAQCHVYLGLASHKQGKLAEARMSFEQARQSDAKSLYLAKIPTH